MATTPSEMIVTGAELDGRIAFVIGLEPALYRGELTHGRLARRLAALAGAPRPQRPETIEFFVAIAGVIQERLLRDVHPPYWSQGHISSAISGSLAQRLDMTTVPAIREELGQDDLAAIASHLSAGVLAPMLAEAGYMRLFGGEYGEAPYRGEAPDA